MKLADVSPAVAALVQERHALFLDRVVTMLTGGDDWRGELNRQIDASVEMHREAVNDWNRAQPVHGKSQLVTSPGDYGISPIDIYEWTPNVLRRTGHYFLARSYGQCTYIRNYNEMNAYRIKLREYWRGGDEELRNRLKRYLRDSENLALDKICGQCGSCHRRILPWPQKIQAALVDAKLSPGQPGMYVPEVPRIIHKFGLR